MTPLIEILHTGDWRGRRVFVFGSGPSRAAFPVELLRERGELSVGCNEEYRWGPSIAICQDVRFFFGDGTPGKVPARYNKDWYAGSHIPVWFKGHPDRPDPPVDNPAIYTCEAAVALQRSPHGALEFVWPKRLEDGLYYGANCGMAAVSLADVLGADEIILVGFDCGLSPGGRSHWHDHYKGFGWALEEASKTHAESVFKDWVGKWREIQPLIRAKVFVVGPSNLLVHQVFPGLSLSELWSSREREECQSQVAHPPP